MISTKFKKQAVGEKNLVGNVPNITDGFLDGGQGVGDKDGICFCSLLSIQYITFDIKLFFLFVYM